MPSSACFFPYLSVASCTFLTIAQIVLPMRSRPGIDLYSAAATKKVHAEKDHRKTFICDPAHPLQVVKLPHPSPSVVSPPPAAANGVPGTPPGAKEPAAIKPLGVQQEVKPDLNGALPEPKKPVVYATKVCLVKTISAGLAHSKIHGICGAVSLELGAISGHR
jgi:hypothetical protein